MSVATSSQRKDGEKNTTWHRVKVFGPRAEACHTYLVKGRKVDVTGSLHASQWEDKEGVTRYTVEIVADNVVFLDGPRQAEPASV